MNTTKEEEQWMELYIATGNTKDSPRILPNEFLYRMKRLINQQVLQALEELKSKLDDLPYVSYKGGYQIPYEEIEAAVEQIEEKYK